VTKGPAADLLIRPITDEEHPTLETIRLRPEDFLQAGNHPSRQQ